MKAGRRNVLWVLLLVAAAAVLTAAYPRRHPSGHVGHLMSAQKGLYYCPMHPSYTSDKPGDCPICNMRLVKREGPGAVSASALEGYAAVRLSPQKRQMIGIAAEPAQKRKMVRTLRAAGRIAYDPDLYQAQQEYLQALRSTEKAKTMNGEMAERSRQLMESARLRLRILGMGDAAIDSMAGWQGPDRRLLVADEEGRVWLYASLYEYELPWIRVGQKIRVESQALPGQSFEGTVDSIDSILDPQTRTVRARAVLQDPKKFLKPEMYVDAFLESDLGERLAVPEEAVFDTGTRQILFVDKGDGLLEPREVISGARADGYVEIQKGISEGENVVTRGNFLIDSESRLKSALEGAGTGHVHGQ